MYWQFESDHEVVSHEKPYTSSSFFLRDGVQITIEMGTTPLHTHSHTPTQGHTAVDVCFCEMGTTPTHTPTYTSSHRTTLLDACFYELMLVGRVRGRFRKFIKVTSLTYTTETFFENFLEKRKFCKHTAIGNREGVYMQMCMKNSFQLSIACRSIQMCKRTHLLDLFINPTVS